MSEWKKLVTTDELVDQGANAYRTSGPTSLTWYTPESDRDDGEIRIVYPVYGQQEESYEGDDLGSTLASTITVKPVNFVNGIFWQNPYSGVLLTNLIITISSESAFDNSTGMKYALYSAMPSDLDATFGDADWEDNSHITLTRRSAIFSNSWTSVGHASGGGLITADRQFPIGWIDQLVAGEALFIVFQENMSGTATTSNNYQAKVTLKFFATQN